MPTADDDLSLALHLARAAARIALDRRRRDVGHEVKTDRTLVSKADVAVERTLLEILAGERPDDAVLSEECGAVGSADRRWILDPIDGTAWYLADDPGWGTHVALEVHGEVEVAVVTRPTEGRVWWARRGGAAFTEDLWTETSRRRLRASTASDLDGAVLSGWLPPATIESIRATVRWIDPGPDTALGLLDGVPDVMVHAHQRHLWDQAPFVLLVEEAGGTFRDRDGGRRLDASGGVYGSCRLVEAVARLLWPEQS